jgi:DNA repair exonuclease SbcCD ATPase subunit
VIYCDVIDNAALARDIRQIAPMKVHLPPPLLARSSSAAPDARSSVVSDQKTRNPSRKRDASVMSRQSSVASMSSVVEANSANDELVKTLQERLEFLEQENQQLQGFSLEREQEIRIEVCQEMAERSSMLLQQIKELQDELHEHKHDRTDHTKSVKKMRHLQRLESQANMTMELQQSEEEMEVLKSGYEKEIKSLKSEVRSLKAEAADWRKKAEDAMKIAAALKEAASGRGGLVTCDLTNLENEVNSANAAESFDLRMKRDQRFNKHKKLAELSPKLRSHKTREPLSPKSSNVPVDDEDLASEADSSINKSSPFMKSRRSSDALPIAPPMSPNVITGSGPFYPKAKRNLRSQIRA